MQACGVGFRDDVNRTGQDEKGLLEQEKRDVMQSFRSTHLLRVQVLELMI